MLRPLLAACAVLLVSPSLAAAETVFLASPVAGVPHLLAFDSADPGTLQRSIQLHDIPAAETLSALDVRPATGELYGLTVEGTSMRLYRISTTSGVAERIGSAFTITAPTSVGMDFNPTNDRLRVVTDADQNLSVDPNTAVPTAQTALNPPNPAVAGAAYSNNFPGATVTTLFVLDAASSGLYTLTPPATGTMTLIGSTATTVAPDAGFDIVDTQGFAAEKLGGNPTRFYTVNLSSGVMTLLGAVGDGSVESPQGMAVALSGASGLASADTTVAEAAGTATVSVSRTGRTTSAVTLDYLVSEGSAGAADFTASGGSVTIPAGAAGATFSVPVANDTTTESPETAAITVTPRTGALAGRASGTLTILDDDPAPVVTPVATVTPVPTIAPDTTPPVVLLIGQKLKAARSVKVPFACSEACSAAGTLTVDAKTAKRLGSKTRLATASKRLTKAGGGTLTFKLSAKAVRAFRRKAGTISVSLLAVDAGNNRATEKGKLTLGR
jgi:hypothetical protein